MYEFFDRLVNIALPVRDFGRAYQVVRRSAITRWGARSADFSEIDYAKVEKTKA